MQVTLDFDEVQGNVIPDDGAMYEQWIRRTEGLARALRLADPEADAQDVLVDFITSGYHRTWDRTKGRQFDSFCYWMLRNRLLSRLRSQKRRTTREGMPTDLTTVETTVVAYEMVEFEAAENRADLRALADFLDEAHKQRSGVTPAQIVRAMVDADERTGQVDVTTLANELGVTSTTLRHHRAVLRQLLVDNVEADFLLELMPA